MFNDMPRPVGYGDRRSARDFRNLSQQIFQLVSLMPRGLLLAVWSNILL